MRVRSVVFFALLVGCLAGAVVCVAPAAAAEPVELENELAHSATDGKIDVETRLSIPSSVVELEITIPEETDVYERNGFRKTDDRTYEWTGRTNTPSLQYEYEGSVYGARGDREGYFFVAADEWALVRTPGIGVSWRTTDPDTTLVRENTVRGDGVASTHIAYLGPYTEHTGTTARQQFRLIVPDAADLREDPDEIITTLEAAAERLVIGAPTDDVFVIAAPTADHRWAPAGLQRGNGGDMWVRDIERLGTNRDTWVHEYVHTRQRYVPTDETRWTIEGLADYYGALLPYEVDAITHREFRDRLEEGADAEYSDVRLTEPQTWDGTDADYDRGALVFAHLDRRLRADAETSLDAVVAAINQPGEEVTHRQFFDAIEAAGGAEIRADAERYTETTAIPPIPTQREHVEAFGGPDMRYTIEETTVSGPYRSGVLDPPELVVGETLEVSVRIDNVGDESGSFEAAFDVDGRIVAVDVGRLEAGDATTLRFAQAFDTSGEFDVGVGSARRTVHVEEPAGITVVDLTVIPAEPPTGEPVALRATVASAADRPGAGEVVFAIDGANRAIEPVKVGGGTATVETTVEFDAPGDYTVTAGEASTTVRVGGDESGLRSPVPEPASVDDMPGFGPAAAIIALGLAMFVRRSKL